MSAPVTTYRFTVDEYHRMAEAGVFHEDDRVELIAGQVVAMTPIGVAHAGCVNRLTTLFAPVAGSRATLSVQNPVILGEHEEPQPDFAVLRYRADGYGARHPRAEDVLLVIEVADTSVAYDRHTKMPLYARAGIPESWLVNLPDSVIEVYGEPGPDGYRAIRRVGRGEKLRPMILPDVEITAGDILG